MKRKEYWLNEYINENTKPHDLLDPIYPALERLSRHSWMAGFETAKKKIYEELCDLNRPSEFSSNASPLNIEKFGDDKL